MSSTPGDRPEPGPQPAPEGPRPAEPTPAQLAAQQGVPARGSSHYAKGTTSNMMRSMAVIVAITLGLFFVAGRTNSQDPDSVDVAGTAQYRAEQSGQPFAHPEGLPEGWNASHVRYASQDGVMTWTAGYTTPDEEYVSVQQGVDARDEWIETQTSDGAAVGEVTTEDGRDWVRRDSEVRVRRSLVHEPQGADELTTVVAGTGSWEQLEDFADRLVEADPGAKGEPAG